MATDEEKISRLYQQNKNAVPPTQLDSNILKAAHQAVDKPSSVKSPFSGGWPAAASIAAVLIITVILVPLIRQEASTPETKKTAENKLETLNEQDAIERSIAGDISIEATKKAITQKNVSADIRAKKQSLAKEKTRRLTQTLPAREQSSGVTQDQAFAAEEAMVPMTIDALSPPQSAKLITTMGKSSLNDNEMKAEAEAELQQQSSPMLVTDKAPVFTVTPKLWLEKIQQLIEQGKLDLAQEELDQFKTQYPDEEINQSILNSLKERP